MRFDPLKDRVLIRRIEPDEISPGGIIIPDQAKEKPQEGEIIAAGAYCKEVARGDRVLFSKYSGTEIQVNQEDVLIVSEDDILGVMRLTQNEEDESSDV